MPVFSYLAYPRDKAKNALHQALASLAYCEVIPAQNDDLLILVTDTPDEKTEKQLQRKLRRLTALQSLGMTFGHTAEKTQS